MLTLNDGRSELWQWDTGRTLSVDADCSQVHFSNKVFGRSIDVDVAGGVAIIPDVLLQTDRDLSVWAFVGTAENGYTKISKTFKVNRRNKPADYVFTPPEQTTLAELVERLDKIEETQDPDAIKNAVEDYLAQNPVEAPVQSVNGQTGTVELTADDVGALPDSTVIPEALPNPNALTFTGAVTGSYDGSNPLTVNVPSLTVDNSLTKSGQAADAAVVGNRLSALSEEIANLQTSGLTTAQVNALDGMFKVCAFTKADVSAEYTAFKTAFGIADSGDGGETEVTLTGISATYSGGDVPVGTAMTALTGITVTATYSDGSTATVTGYTLSGTIAEGSNTITVSYGGKTTTINVTGVADSGGESTDGTEWTDGVPYAYTIVPNEYVGTEQNNDNGLKTYNGWSRTPFLPCKGVSSITVTYIDDSKNRLTGAYACWYDADQKYITSFQPNTANLSSVPTDACFVIISQSDTIMNNIASITPNA